jgi:type IV pilus assembly protein PilM
MAQGIVGIDIGANAVRVVRVSKVTDDGYALVDRVGVTRIREGTVIAGVIKSPQTVAMAISSALKSAGVSGYGAVVGLASPNVAVAVQNVPSLVGRDGRVSSLRALNRQISPTLPLATSELATSLIRSETSAEGMANDVTLVAAAARADVGQLRTVCSLAKVTPRAIDLSAAATLRALYRGPEDAADTASVVDIGATKVTIATRQGPHLRSLRVLPGGGDELTRALMRDGDMELEEAERRKRLLSLPDANRLAVDLVAGDDQGTVGYGAEGASPEESIAPKTTLDMVLVSLTDSLIEQVAQALDNHAVTYGSYPQGVVLAGGGALLKGLKERLGQRLGIEVHLGAPWARLAGNRSTATLFTADGIENPQAMLELTTAIGLACWREPR